MNKKIQILTAVIFIIFFYFNSINIAFAQILPKPDANTCDTSTESAFKETIKKMQDPNAVGQNLGCKIKTGVFLADDIPYYLKYIADFLLGIVGLISTLFIVLGGYHYIIGGLTEEKEKGKNTIKHALYGLVLALLSWVIVNTIISIITT
jgi:hypothetical protein